MIRGNSDKNIRNQISSKERKISEINDQSSDNLSGYFPISVNLNQSNNNLININIIRCVNRRIQTTKENLPPNKKFYVRKVKKIEGDNQVEEFDESKFFPQSKKQQKIEINITPVFQERIFRKTSIVFKDMSKEDLKLVRERDLTPIVERNSKLNKIERPDFQDDSDADINKSSNTFQKKISFHDSTNNIINFRSSKASFHPQHSGFYEILTDEKSIIKLTPKYKTEDFDLKHVCDLINESKDLGWKEVYCQENISIFRKSQKGNPSIMLKTFAMIENYTKEEVFMAIADVRIRKEWDKVFQEFKIIDNNKDNDGKEVLYMSIKSPSIFVADRDFVQQRKIWKNFPDENSAILHFKSVDHPLAPEKNHIVRANTLISGYFIKTISTNPPKTFITIISQTDIKGSIPKWLVNSLSQKAPKEWINNLIRGCHMTRSYKQN